MTTGNSLAMLPWFVRDYIAATRHFSLAERGAYTDLLFLQWEVGPLPKDLVRLARLVGCGADEFGLVWPAIRGKFIETEAGLLNQRLEEHRTEAHRRARLVSEAAREKARRRWHGTSNGSAPAMPQHSNGSAPAMPQQSPSNADAMHPSPSPSPSPDSGVLEDSDSRPRKRTSEIRPTALQQQIIEAYHQLLPDLPRVKVWNRKRARALEERIRERCAEGETADHVDYWREFFRRIAGSDFLCGRSTNFRADLEWLICEKNFPKAFEGRYAARAQGAPQAARREREERERAELERLKAKREEMGIPNFRPPLSIETPAVYETAMRQAARETADESRGAARVTNIVRDLGAAKRLA